MKKGFTMIELIFVIVILGILASVAIPRLAATREDAEISAAVANLRTLVSDVTAYYTAKGNFYSAGTTTAKWNQITNVPLENAASTDATTEATLKEGKEDCIGVQLVTTTPAHIKFTKKTNPKTGGVCAQVQGSKPLEAYFNSKVKNGNTDITSAIAIGSSTSVYTTPTQ